MASQFGLNDWIFVDEDPSAMAWILGPCLAHATFVLHRKGTGRAPPKK